MLFRAFIAICLAASAVLFAAAAWTAFAPAEEDEEKITAEELYV